MNMGYIEIHNQDGLGGWTDLDDIAFIETVNCQLCNEPTEARDIMAIITIKDGQPSVGQWQCRKCHAVNG
jgi:MinD superfamily P-loop ATPase